MRAESGRAGRVELGGLTGSTPRIRQSGNDRFPSSARLLADAALEGAVSGFALIVLESRPAGRPVYSGSLFDLRYIRSDALR